MEEILASIRRIIADEDPEVRAKEPAGPPPVAVAQPVAVAPVKKAEPPPALPEPDEDVLDLAMAAVEAEAVVVSPPQAVRPTIVEPVEPPDIDFEDLTPQPPPAAAVLPRVETAWVPPPRPAPEAPQPPPTPEERLLSPGRDSEVAAAFGSLSRAVFSPEPRTIEDLTKELLKPMLRDWLDDNLPPLVERLVREEIERVARGRR